MGGALELVQGFWHDVGEEKRPTKQYSPDYDLNMRIRSTPTWRRTYRCYYVLFVPRI